MEIKPISPNGTTPTGNEEDIKKFMEGLRLSPSAMVGSQSDTATYVSDELLTFMLLVANLANTK